MSAAARRWLELSARCRGAGDRDGLLVDGLLSLGGRATVERAGWHVTYMDDPGDVDAFVRDAARVLAAATGLEGIELRTAWQDHEEWAETWKRGLGVRRITDRIVVRPSWLEAEAPEDADVVIVLDPGVAFGTAEHGTTRGCLRLLDRVVRPGDRALDVGAGSGILSVAIALLGAAEVVAFEGEPLACEALVENVSANGVGDRVSVERGWATVDRLLVHRPVSGVVANIEEGLLTPLLPGLVGAVRPGGWLVLAGVLDRDWIGFEERVRAQGAHLDEVRADGEWRSGLFRRPS